MDLACTNGDHSACDFAGIINGISLPAGPTVILGGVFLYTNDGIVPTASAVFAEHTIGGTHYFGGYDHQDLVCGIDSLGCTQSSTDTKVFNQIRSDLAITPPTSTSDLIPKSISLNSSSFSPGASLTVNWTLSNVGNAAANAASTTVIRINQSPTKATGTNLASVPTSALVAQSSASQSATVAAPATPGTYYVWVIADDFSKVTNQSDTSNDLQPSAAFTVTGPSADLVPTGIAPSAPTVTAGATYSASWTLTNNGSVAANSTSTTVVRINQDPNSSAPIVNLAGVSTAALAAQTAITQSVTLTAPSTPGTYYVWVLADDFSEVTNQTNTANDIARSAAFTVATPANSLLVSPGTNLSASGAQGGPFSSSSVQYQVSASSGTVNYAISVTYNDQGVSNWLSITPTLSGGVGTSPVFITAALNSNANSLTPGTYSATINFTNTSNNLSIQRAATLTVAQPGAGSLQVSSGDILSSGPQSGPFAPDTFTYQLSASSGSVGFSIANWPNWLTPLTTSGTASTSPTTVTFLVNSNAELLSGGTYGPTAITFANTTNDQGNTTRNATLTVAPTPVLQVTPATDISVSGNQGGPFSQTSFSYTLSATTGSVNYQILYTPSWLTPSSTSGTVTTSGTTVTFTVNASADSLTAGGYTGTILFSNVTNFFNGPGSQTRFATLTVQPSGTGTGASFQGLGFLPGGSFELALGISGDGNVVVGQANDPNAGNDFRAFRWINGSISDIGALALGDPCCRHSEAFGANSDGSVIAGDSFLGGSSYQAAVWNNGAISALPNLLPGDTYSSARAVNYDGSVIVGFSEGTTGQAVRWVNGSVSGLGLLPGSNISAAYGVNSDGTVAVGFSCNNNNCVGTEQAFRWVNGTMSSLGFLPGGNTSVATSINSDGTVVVGSSTNGSGNTQAFRWVNGTMNSIGFPGSTNSAATATNSDGTVVVGGSDGNPGGPFRWTPIDGINSIANLLTAAGVSFTGWSLSSATAVSSDGTVIVGDGTNPSGQQEAWIAHLPLPTALVPVLQVTPSSNIIASGSPGGPFTPGSFLYQLSASSGTVGYSISGVPSWLTASSTSGSATTSPSTITFTINSTANNLSPAAYIATITFTNTNNSNADLTVSATLTVNAPTYNLSVGVSGSGTVTSSPSGINCGSTCNATYTGGTVVALTPFPAQGWNFSGWTGACTGTGGCSVTMSSALNVSAVFVNGNSGSQTGRTWVSAAAGSDSNPCSRSAPCLTFAAALAQTMAGGEIDVLDPGDFGPVTVTKSVSIYGDAAGVAGTIPSSGTSGIIISAGANDLVYLHGLIFDGVNASGTSGVVFTSGAELHIHNCVLQGFTTSGITFSPGAGSATMTHLIVRDTTILNNATGILTRPTGGVAAKVMLRRLHIDNNTGEGLRIDGTGGSGAINVAIADSTASFNASNGIDAVSGPGNTTVGVIRVVAASNGSAGILSNQANGGTASVTVASSTLLANGIGIQAAGSASLLSYDNNQVAGNVSNGSFTGTAGFQ
jgi:probable HAF family extracellular repeat protein